MALLVAAVLSLQLADTHGARHELSDHRGRVVLVNFWATWCEPCRAELPGLEKLRATLAGKPFTILAVEMDGSARTSQDTADELRLHFPMLLDRDSKVSEAWGVTLLPTTFLIGPDGAVAEKVVGERDWSSAKLRRKIEALLPKR